MTCRQVEVSYCTRPGPCSRRIGGFLLAALFVLVGLSNLDAAGGESLDTVRAPILAGTWYPGERGELQRMIHAFLSGPGMPAPEAQLLGLVVPHAGYMYSGRVAAHAFSMLKESGFQRVILLGPSHRMELKGVSVDLSSGYKTPLGVTPVDQDFGKRLIRENPSAAWIPQAHEREHSLEIQVPFLQTVLPNVRIVPLLMGRQDLAASERLASAITRLIGTDPKTLILASSDLSHFHRDERARSMDGEFIRLLKTYDPEGLARSLSAGRCEACGVGPVLAAMLACKGLGAARAIQLSYGTSGDVTGDRSRVVGYLSAALVR